ncbi:DUF2254 family protein [Streptomyces sp. NPDC087917]|uniref:DUF2254 family protein n=1 Tax=Streptomyces sp. NPDC087917 TaxID=3155060 RepID=UPI003424E61C
MPGPVDVAALPAPRRPRRRRTPFQRPNRAVRRGLSQLVCAVGGLLLGLMSPLVAVGPRVSSGQAVTLLFTIGFGVVSLVSIIYSMLFLVVQFSASSFSPRLGLFREEPIVWRAYAFTVGVFVFSVTSGMSIGTSPQVSALVPCVAALLALCALGMMRTLQTKAFHSIQLAHALTAVTTRADRLYDDLYQRPYDGPRPAAPPPAPSAAGTRTHHWRGPAAVIQQIDVPALVRAAATHGGCVTFLVPPGRTVSRGTPFAEVTCEGPAGSTAVEAIEAALGRAVGTGVERTFDQDPELPLRLLADIALRALSPAVNDPATAVESLDRTDALLTRLAGRDLEIGAFADAGGTPRVLVPVPGWERYVRTAVDDVLHAAADSPMALLRMRALLTGLLARCPEERRPVLRERLAWADRTGRATFPLLWDPADL